jgi:hypothetical protein
MYTCSIEYEVIVMGDKAKEIVKLINGIVDNVKQRIS